MEEVVKLLSKAVEIVDRADVPEPLREVAFSRTIDVLLGQAAVASPSPPADVGRASTAAASAPGSNDRFALIARELDINESLAERLFDDHEGQLQFIGPLERLGSSKQLMVEGVALLLCAGRTAAGYDEDGRTPDYAVRAEIERLGLYDVTNYSKHVKKLRQLANANGSGRSTTYKLKYDGKVRARELAREVLGGAA